MTNQYDLQEVNEALHPVGSAAWREAVQTEHNYTLLATYVNEHGTKTQYNFDDYAPFEGQDEAPPHAPCTWQYANEGVNEWRYNIDVYTRPRGGA